MANKTFIPAFEARVGDWNYYIAVMKYAQVAREIQFAHDLGGNTELKTLIQRGIGARTADITKYLLSSEHRFLGAIIVAAWGGEPKFLTLQMEDNNELLKGIDQGFGVLTLDGSQQFFALDGQHRLKAIKDAIKVNPAIGSEDICVLLVAHYDTAEGRERTQRLFTNINRNAKATTNAENIALDVDDGFAVVLRELLTSHPRLSKDGVVKIFTKKPTGDGEFTLASSSVPKTDKAAWTTIGVLYDVLRDIGMDLDPSMHDRTVRPSDEVIHASEKVLGLRIDDLLKRCGSLGDRLDKETADVIRSPKKREAEGHPFMRPVVQKAVARAAANLVFDQKVLTWDQFLDGLSSLPWVLGEAPWTAVFNVADGTMITAKENTLLLDELLVAHLAPPSKSAIQRARKKYHDLRGKSYPVGVDVLSEGIVQEDSKP